MRSQQLDTCRKMASLILKIKIYIRPTIYDAIRISMVRSLLGDDHNLITRWIIVDALCEMDAFTDYIFTYVHTIFDGGDNNTKQRARIFMQMAAKMQAENFRKLSKYPFSLTQQSVLNAIVRYGKENVAGSAVEEACLGLYG